MQTVKLETFLNGRPSAVFQEIYKISWRIGKFRYGQYMT
jgi:hypothetical protein